MSVWKESMSLITHLDRLPPAVCLALARAGKRTLTLPEVAEKSGVPLRTLARIASRHTWAGVKLRTLDAIATACGVDLLNQSKDRERLRRSVIGRRDPLGGMTGKGIAAYARERRRQGVFRVMAEAAK